MTLAPTPRTQVAARAADRSGQRRPALLLAAAALLMLWLVPVGALAQRAAASGARPTIVLVHGAWAGPSGWDGVVAGLRKDGYATATPRLNLMTLAEDVATVRATLSAIPGDKVLVGHSYGGFVVSNAAYGRSDVRGLVYTACVVRKRHPAAFGCPCATRYDRRGSGGPGRRPVIDSGGGTWCAGSCSPIWWRSSSTCSA